ncbi:MAG: linear amide C-N hydrolase [Candidatus Zixiibacteriota bacterium]|nr:MAG: linear amide C-N hydrolase [candidate division Zixibacteria bacterium]
MTSNCRKTKTTFLTLVLLLAISALVSAQDEITELEFAQPPDSGSNESRTLQSMVKVLGTDGPCHGGLYLLTHSGDRKDLFQTENQKMIDNPLIDQTWRYCSVFSATTGNSVTAGRNFDNQNVGSIIISLYRPPDGYSSISFSRAIELGFGLNLDLERFRSSEMGNRLLLAPFYATDGINEHGLVVGLAGVKQITHEAKDGAGLVFVTFMVRKILDQARNIEEAMNVVEKSIPFDADKNSLNTHFFIVDATGRSVTLEYDQDQWRRIHGDKSWQVLTNKPIFEVPDADLREKCWRYRSISETLEKTQGNIEWKAGMKILQDVTQEGTTWSVIYSPTTKDVYFSVYQNWDTVYHLTVP